MYEKILEKVLWQFNGTVMVSDDTITSDDDNMAL